MLSVFDGLRDVTTLSVFVRLACALICGGIIGIERSYKRRPAGFRTHILICIGATITTLTSQYLYLNMHYFTDMARLGAQVVAGIGFIGAGTIIVTKRQRVKGLTTAAGLWASACMGLAIGAGFYECVVLGTVLIFLSMRFLPTIENMMVERAPFLNIYVEFESLDNIGAIIGRIKEQNSQILDVEIDHGRGEGSGNPSAAFSLRLPRHQPHSDVLVSVSGLDCVYTVEEF